MVGTPSKTLAIARRLIPSLTAQEFLEASFSGEAKSVATVERYLSTIAHAHTLTNLPDPTRTAHVRGAYRHLARGKTASQPKAALRSPHIAHALEHLNTGHTAWDLRAKALLAAAYCTMARRAELVSLKVSDLSFNTRTGDGVALIRNTKAGREESRYLSVEAVKSVKAGWHTRRSRMKRYFGASHREGRLVSQRSHPVPEHLWRYRVGSAPLTAQ